MKIINTLNAPQAIGPYSQGIIFGNLVFLSGQIGIDPKTNEISSSIEAQANQVFKNIGEILKEAGLDYSSVVKTTLFIKDIKDFSLINQIYSTYFKTNPARSCVEVSNLPKGALIECEVIAIKE
jgi:2-iminobutanoate/2-iminopropanoate deaminase